MVRISETGPPMAGSVRPAWVVPSAYAWVAGFALIHVLAIASNGEYGAGVDPGKGDSGLACVLPNALVIVICLCAVGVIHRTTHPPHPLVPGWMVLAGARVGMPLLVLRGAATVVDEALRLTGVMPYGIFDQHEDAASAWAQWSGRAIDVYFILGAIILAWALGPWLKRARRRTFA